MLCNARKVVNQILHAVGVNVADGHESFVIMVESAGFRLDQVLRLVVRALKGTGYTLSYNDYAMTTTDPDNVDSKVYRIGKIAKQ